MQSTRARPSSADVAIEANTLLTGLAILTIQAVPLALPGLLLFVVAPLALVAVFGLLLAIPFLLVPLLTRILRQRRNRRRNAAVWASDEIGTIATGSAPQPIGRAASACQRVR